jgi:hypothetical protein
MDTLWAGKKSRSIDFHRAMATLTLIVGPTFHSVRREALEHLRAYAAENSEGGAGGALPHLLSQPGW